MNDPLPRDADDNLVYPPGLMEAHHAFVVAFTATSLGGIQERTKLGLVAALPLLKKAWIEEISRVAPRNCAIPPNHDEAHQLAGMKAAESNLARCYLDLRKRLDEAAAKIHMSSDGARNPERLADSYLHQEGRADKLEAEVQTLKNNLAVEGKLKTHWRGRTEIAERQLGEHKKYVGPYVDAVEKVFQGVDKTPAILPGFLHCGDSKIEGIVHLAEAYKSLVGRMDPVCEERRDALFQLRRAAVAVGLRDEDNPATIIDAVLAKVKEAHEAYQLQCKLTAAEHLAEKWFQEAEDLRRRCPPQHLVEQALLLVMIGGLPLVLVRMAAHAGERLGISIPRTEEALDWYAKNYAFDRSRLEGVRVAAVVHPSLTTGAGGEANRETP